jgi:hypothetical protein
LISLSRSILYVIIEQAFDDIKERALCEIFLGGAIKVFFLWEFLARINRIDGSNLKLATLREA